MDTLREYLSSLVIVAAVAGLLSAFSPVSGTMKKYINYAIALAVVIVLLSPLKSLLNVISSLDNLIILESETRDKSYDEEREKTDKWILEKSQDTIKEGIKILLYDRFGIPEEEVEVELELDRSDPKAVVIEKLRIQLTGYSMWKDSREIESYITSLVGCECEVVNG
ncbi:MAG: hypothetical protein GX303_02935 [Clostridiales bacterium]|nr:hypothetical protein [Clostridiales bacterium]